MAAQATENAIDLTGNLGNETQRISTLGTSLNGISDSLLKLDQHAAGLEKRLTSLVDSDALEKLQKVSGNTIQTH